MKKMTSTEVRQMFLDFFKSKGHSIEPSQSLVPVNDPTLLWINSGVATLKQYFDGSVVPENPRITNAQKSIRTNDIENVGKTARHHTMFEMLGNFSIGDYFREEALAYAWEMLTSSEYFDFPAEKLYITYYPDDKDTFNRWVELGVDASHLVPIVDNFWERGAGPSGPDTEIFFDIKSCHRKILIREWDLNVWFVSSKVVKQTLIRIFSSLSFVKLNVFLVKLTIQIATT